MTADVWQGIGSIAVTIVVGGWGAWQAHKAKKYAEPTGNGFAAEVTSALKRIEERQKRDGEILYDHISAHANADVLKGARHESSPGTDAP